MTDSSLYRISMLHRSCLHCCWRCCWCLLYIDNDANC